MRINQLIVFMIFMKQILNEICLKVIKDNTCEKTKEEKFCEEHNISINSNKLEFYY